MRILYPAKFAIPNMMSQVSLRDMEVSVQQQVMLLHPLRALFWPEERMLICADVHIGKGAHFRKNGISIPGMVNKNNFWNLSVLIDRYNPEHLMILGDLVHSHENAEWDDLRDFLDNYPEIRRTLVRGNHEFMEDSAYESLGFEVLNEWRKGEFLFTHEPANEKGYFNLHGHIHPAIMLYGPARQSLRLPCFVLGEKAAVLPAFGEFTGTFSIRPKRSERIYAISPQEIIEIK